MIASVQWEKTVMDDGIRRSDAPRAETAEQDLGPYYDDGDLGIFADDRRRDHNIGRASGRAARAAAGRRPARNGKVAADRPVGREA
jgi:hypothetical protein